MYVFSNAYNTVQATFQQKSLVTAIFILQPCTWSPSKDEITFCLYKLGVIYRPIAVRIISSNYALSNALSLNAVSISVQPS